MEWISCTLDKLGEVIGGATPSTKNIDNYNNGNISWITPKDLSNFNERYISSGERNITIKGYSSCSTKLLPKNSILFSSRAPIGYVAIAKNKLCTNQGFKSIIPNKKTDSLFLYYLLKYNTNSIINMGSGTTFKEISGKTMKSIIVTVPKSLINQKKIASILSSLDDKIELNNKINKNLEEMAQAIFKSWFVNFESWGGKQPKNWQQSRLGDFAKIKRGGSPRPIKDFLSKTGLSWLKISDATGLESPFILDIKEHIKKDGLKKTVFLKSGSLVLSNSATPGVPKILCVDTCIHDGWLYFPSSYFSNEYLYLFFQIIRKELVSLGNGSVFTNLKTDILKNYSVIVPDKKILKDFDVLVQPLFSQIKCNAKESKKLALVRDTLTSKLMSGELDVSNLDI